MLGRDYPEQTCSIARTLEVIGERWTMLIVRDIFLGLQRFDDIQAELGIARNVLASRLERLVADGAVTKVPYQERPTRYEYRLTAKGLDLWPVIAELIRWGDRHAPTQNGPTVILRHRACGGELGSGQLCKTCGAVVERHAVVVEVGPGASADHPIHRHLANSAARAGGAAGSRPGSA
jgi:DNA-binding HxlR family transcriptional regulator